MWEGASLDPSELLLQVLDADPIWASVITQNRPLKIT